MIMSVINGVSTDIFVWMIDTNKELQRNLKKRLENQTLQI